MKKFLAKLKAIIMDINFSGMSKGTIIRGVSMILVAVNTTLNFFGMSPIQVSDEDMQTIINIGVVVITVGVMAVSYWKNNDITKTAQSGLEKKKELDNEIIK